MKRFVVKEDSWVPRIAEIIASQGEAGIDVETTALEDWQNDPDAGLDPFKSRPRLIQIATNEISWVLDMNYVKDITPILNLFPTDVMWVIHNALFETKVFLHHFNAYPDRVFDTFLASRLLQVCFDYLHKNSLEACAERYIGVKLDKTEQRSGWKGELSESQLDYAFKDAEVLLPIYRVLSQILEQEGMSWSARVEFDAVLPLAEMELRGLTLDRKILTDLTGLIETRIYNLERYLATELPEQQYGLFQQDPINLNSPQQLIDAFERRTGVRLTKRVRGEGWGEWNEKESADKTALLRHRKAFPRLVDALLDYGSLSNFLGFCEVYKSIHPVTGKIHPEILQLGQLQHRTATRHPNLNFPRPNSFGPGVSTPSLIENFKADVSFRQLFMAEEDRMLSIVDFAGNQLRILCDEPFANERSLIEEFNRPKANPYKRIASLGLGIPYDQVTDVQRFAYKTLTLALMFICGVDRFMDTRLEETREEMKRWQAELEIASFFKAVPGVSNWHGRVLPELKEKGYVYTPKGRKIWIRPEYMTPNRAANFPICGTEVDGSKLAIGRISREIRRQGIDSRPVMFVYDELVYDVRESEAQKMLDLQIKMMQDSMSECLVKVPSIVEGSIGKSWGSKK